MQEKTSRTPWPWMILATVIIGTFLSRLDQTVVNLAIPKIVDDYGITVTAASWIATAYIIANAVFVPIWGKLGDTIGRKRVYILGFGGFVLASILAGFAWNLGSMIVFRIIQAVAGSADYPTAMAIIAITFRDPKQRTQALGIWSSAFASSAVFGPLVGGPLIDAFGWRSVFFLNIPIGIIGLLMAMAYIPESRSAGPRHRFDWFGAGTLGAALSALVLILDKGNSWGWASAGAWTCYAAAALFGMAFFAIERRHPEPVVDLSIFRNRTVNGALANNFLMFLCMMGSVFAVPIFAQTFLGMTATQSGLLFVPMGLCIPLSAGFIGRVLAAKMQPRWAIFAGTLGASSGFFLLSLIDPRSSAFDLWAPLALMALCMGPAFGPSTNAIVSSVPHERVGTASSVLALNRNIGGAFGIAIFATLINVFSENGVLALARNSVINAVTPAQHATAVALIELKAQVMAYSHIYLIAGSVMVLAACVALFMKKSRPPAASHEDMAMAEAG